MYQPPTYTIVRSRTGVYHRASVNGPQLCNSRVGAFRITLAKTSDIEKAPESSFCRKCFPNGNPVK